MLILDVIFGFLMVVAGRNLFWLCVGLVGFLMGTQFAIAMGLSNGWTALLTAIALGSIGALLAISFEWLAVVFGVGFLGGGYLLMNIFPSSAQQDPYSWLIFVVGGIVGMCLMIITFDFALIIISSLLGASLIVNAFHVAPGLRELLFLGSIIIGLFVQSLSLQDNLN